MSSPRGGGGSSRYAGSVSGQSGYSVASTTSTKSSSFGRAPRWKDRKQEHNELMRRINACSIEEEEEKR